MGKHYPAIARLDRDSVDDEDDRNMPSVSRLDARPERSATALSRRAPDDRAGPRPASAAPTSRPSLPQNRPLSLVGLLREVGTCLSRLCADRDAAAAHCHYCGKPGDISLARTGEQCRCDGMIHGW